MQMKGLVAIVTGASRGLGYAIAREYGKEGARVVVTARPQSPSGLSGTADQTAREIQEAGGDALAVPCDVADEYQVQAMVKQVMDHYGQIDVLVNNAGVGEGGDKITAFTVAQWDRILGVNATGVFLGTRHAARAMRRTGGGSIINISSIYGLVGAPGEAPYPASKGAVRSFTKVAAVQLAPDNIRVNSVHPGFIDTPQTNWMMVDPAVVQGLEERTPLGRIATPEDVAWGVLYLASDESSYMTGSEFVIDGGITAQ